jgi:Uma2 family endonuclease
MVARIIVLLGRYGGQLTPYAGFVLSVTQTRFRVPDVVCYPADVSPGDDLDQQPPPLAIFEILSRTDPLSEMQAKCQEYSGLGVQHIFIVDYANRAVLVPQGAGFLPLENSVSFSVKADKITISFADLFDGF